MRYFTLPSAVLLCFFAVSVSGLVPLSKKHYNGKLAGYDGEGDGFYGPAGFGFGGFPGGFRRRFRFNRGYWGPRNVRHWRNKDRVWWARNDRRAYRWLRRHYGPRFANQFGSYREWHRWNNRFWNNGWADGDWNDWDKHWRNDWPFGFDGFQ